MPGAFQLTSQAKAVRHPFAKDDERVLIERVA